MSRRGFARPDGAELLSGRVATLMSRAGGAAASVVDPAPEQLDERTEEAERTLHGFTRGAWHVLEPDTPMIESWHFGCVCEHLEAVFHRQIGDLIINMPFGYAKSILTCVMLFCWGWLKDPGHRWAFTSYASNLTERDHDKCRRVIGSNWYQARWGSRYRITKDRTDELANDRQGFRLSSSVGGIGTGVRVDTWVMDDIISVAQARSAAERHNVNSYVAETVMGRGRNPLTYRKILIHHRLHANDPTGYVMANQRGWEHLVLPVEYDPRRYLLPGQSVASVIRNPVTPTSLQQRRPELRDPRTKSGEPLWPQRYGAEIIRAEKGKTTPTAWAAQANQNPTPAEGNMFKPEFLRGFYARHHPERGWVLYLRQPEGEPVEFLAEQCWWFQTLDTANSVSKSSSYTAQTTFAVTPLSDLCVWNVARYRLEPPDQWDAISHWREGPATWDGAAREWHRAGRWPVPLRFQACERKATGYGLISQAARAGRPLVGLEPGRDDKVQRLSDALVMAQNGKLYAHEGQEWRTEWDAEILAVPGGEHWDMADTLAYGGILVARGGITGVMAEGDLIAAGPGQPGVGLPEPERNGSYTFGGVTVEFGDD